MQGRHRRRLTIEKLAPIIILSLTVGCLENSPSRDLGSDVGCQTMECEENLTDASRAREGPQDMGFMLPDVHPAQDAAQTDLGLSPDASQESDLGPPGAGCHAIEAEAPTPSLVATTRIQQLSVGTPLTDQQWWLGNLDGDPTQQGELVIVRGGRVEALQLSGRPLWRSPVLGITRIADVTDLDGDGGQEVIVAGIRSLHVVNGLTGQIRWSLPETAFDTDAIKSITRVMLVDVTGEEVPDLYITDGGCGDEGTGRGVVYTFTGPEFGMKLTTIIGDRANGRCGRWQTAADVDGDGNPEIIVTDGNGLNAYDALNGQAIACGTLESAPSNGPLPTLKVAPDRAEWFVFLDGQIVLQTVEPDTDDLCPTPLAFVSVFASPEVDKIRPRGSAVVDFPSVGVPAILTSVWTEATQRWSVIIYGPIGQENIADDAVLLATIPESDGQISVLLRRQADANADTHSGPCEMRTLAPNGQLGPGERLGVCEPTRAKASLDRSSEFSPPQTSWIQGQAHGVITEWTEGQSRAKLPKKLRFLGPLNRQYQSDIGIQSILSASRAIRDLDVPLSVAFSTENTGIATLSDEAVLSTAGPDTLGRPLQRAIGAAQIQALSLAGQPHFLSVTTTGYLALNAIQETQSSTTWGTALGRIQRGNHSVKLVVNNENGRIVSRYPIADEEAIAGRNLSDGALLWVHSGSDQGLKSMRSIELGQRDGGQSPLVLRYDRQVSEGPVPVDPLCAQRNLVGEPRDGRDPQCPDNLIFRRVVSAHDVDTGHCVWQSIVEPTTPCAGPSNQTISVVGNRVFITESRGLVALDVADGTLVARQDLGNIQGMIGRGGGRIIPGGGVTPYIRIGGNGVPEGYDQALQRQWRAAEIPGLRSQSWIRRDGVAVNDSLWTTPGPGFPLYRYALADGQVVERLGLRNGQVTLNPEPDERFASVVHLLAIPDVDGRGAPGLMVITDEAVMYGLLDSGELAWSRTFDATLGEPIFFEPSPPTNARMAIPMTRGQVDIFGPPGPTAPPLVWDLACPMGPRCDEALDIDESSELGILCGQWTPVNGVDGYVYRIAGVGGVPITSWIDSDGENRFELMVDNLSLGAQYRVQVRSYMTEGDKRVFSTIESSDGVFLSNASAPMVTLMANSAQLSSTVSEIELQAHAEDDANLAGWRLDIIRVDTDTHVRRIGGGPLAQPIWAATRLWFGTDRFNVPVSPGLYRAELSVIDRSGNEGAATIDLVVCDGECP